MVRAAAALALSGRYAAMGRQAAEGLEAWARSAGCDLRVEDDRSDPERSAALTVAMAGSADLLFGPYGSGPGRAVAAAMAGRPEPVWNHGAAAVEPRGALGGADVFFVGGGVVRHQAAVSAEEWADGAKEGLAVLRRFSRARSGAGPLAPDALDEAAIVGDRLEALRGSGAAVELGAGWRTADALARIGEAGAARAVAVPVAVPDAPDDDPPEG